MNQDNLPVKAFVINLESSIDRKAYMHQILDALSYLDVEFVQAVNGKAMSEAEISECFDQAEAFRHYGRNLRPGEIGCTLSHKKCAQMLLDSSEKCALVLEDDLLLRNESDLGRVLNNVAEIIDSSKPMIVLFSGDYWFVTKKKMIDGYDLASVRDAVCTQSYMINRAGAEKLLELGNWHVADDWWAIKKKGIILKAVFPHMADQNRADLDTVIAETYGGMVMTNISVPLRIHHFWRSAVKYLLAKTHHFEAKNFKWR